VQLVETMAERESADVPGADPESRAPGTGSGPWAAAVAPEPGGAGVALGAGRHPPLDSGTGRLPGPRRDGGQRFRPTTPSPSPPSTPAAR